MHWRNVLWIILFVFAAIRDYRRRKHAKQQQPLVGPGQLSEVIEDPPDVASDEPEECTCENNGDLCDFCLARDQASHEYLYSPEWNAKRKGVRQ